MENLEFLKAVRKYIEEAELEREGEFGVGRDLDTLIRDNAMPNLYQEVVRRIELMIADGSVKE